MKVELEIFCVIRRLSPSMGILGWIFTVLLVGFVAMTLGVQIMVRSRAAALKGSRVPELPGPIGQKLSQSQHALVYFFSPQCGACRAITPVVRKLAASDDSVFAVDVSENMPFARAFSVMATPSTIEIEEGRVVGYHIGPIPTEVMRKFA